MTNSIITRLTLFYTNMKSGSNFIKRDGLSNAALRAWSRGDLFVQLPPDGSFTCMLIDIMCLD